MSSLIYVIGHSPPPVTGENLCRRQLISTFEKLGRSVVARGRLDFRNLLLFRRRVWILSGAKFHGHVRDVAFILWWMLTGNRVSVYIHNISWLYFLRFSLLWRLCKSRLRFVVLTDAIRDSLRQAGLEAVRLNNTLSDGEERVASPKSFVPRLFWFSAITVDKGFLTAYETYASLRSSDSSWRFDVYGVGPLFDPKRFPLATFHGFTSGAAKDAAFNAGGILLLPSRYKNETQPLAVIESLHYGVPFLASNIGGLAGMLGDNDRPSGICLPVDAAQQEWRDAILHIKDGYDRYSAGALVTYKNKFSRQAFTDNLVALEVWGG